MAAPYFACSGDAATTPERTLLARPAPSATAARAASSRPRASGRRARRGRSRPPRRCRARSAARRGRSRRAGRERPTRSCAAPSASSGVKVRSACCTRLPSWPSTALGTSVGFWVTKKTPTPLDRISRTVWVTDSRNALLAPVNSRCASSRKNTSFGLVEVADLGQLLEQLGEQPHQEGGEQCRPVLHGGQSSTALITPRPSGAVRSRSAAPNSGSPKNTSPPRSSRPISSRRMTPAVAGDRPPRPFRCGLALVAGQPADDGAEVLEVEQRQPGVVGVVEDQAERALLRVVEVEDLRQQHRAEVGHRGPHRDPGAEAAERRGTPRGSRWAPRRRRCRPPGAVTRSAVSPGCTSPARSPLRSASTTGTPAAESCSAISCSVLVLPVPVAPAIRPCRLSIASGSRTWAAGCGFAAEHDRAELERRPVDGVPGGDPRRGLGRVRSRGRRVHRSPRDRYRWTRPDADPRPARDRVRSTARGPTYCSGDVLAEHRMEEGTWRSPTASVQH